MILGWRKEPEARRHQPLRELTREELLYDLQTTSGARLGERARDRFQWIVEADGPAGWVTLVVRSWEHGIGEIAYNLAARAQGKGVGTKAVGALLERCFLEGGLYRIEARCSVFNVPSYRLLERHGFTREATLREYFMLRGKRVDHYFYSLLRPEWEARRGNDER